MNWIKKNPAQLSLAVAALFVLGVAFTLYSNANGFSDSFQGGNASPAEDNKIPPTELKAIDERLAALGHPAQWAPKKRLPFVPPRILINKDGKPEDPTTEGLVPLHPPVPNKFIIEHGLDITLPTVLTDDVDNDGFSLLLEYFGMDGTRSTNLPEIESDSTDPTKADSHPPYDSLLYLVRIHKIQFRLVFRTYDLDTITKKYTIQINPLDRGGRTVFVEEGKTVPNTEWKFESFVLKEQGDKDLSMANMVNLRNGQKLTLTVNVIGDSPESFAQFAYRWMAPGGTPTKDFAKKKDESFGLDPEPSKIYKVVEIKDDSVEVLLPSGQKKVFKLTLNPPK